MSAFKQVERNTGEPTGVERLSDRQSGHSWTERRHTWLGVSSPRRTDPHWLRIHAPATVPAKKSSLGSKAGAVNAEYS